MYRARTRHPGAAGPAPRRPVGRSHGVAEPHSPCPRGSSTRTASPRSPPGSRSRSMTWPGGSCSTTSRTCSPWTSTARTWSRSPGTRRGPSSTGHGHPTASGSCIATPRAASTTTTRSSWRGPTARSGGTSRTTRRTTGDRTGRPTGRRSRSTRIARAAQLRGYLVDPDGANLRRIDVDAWVEYPSFSPDGTRIAFMGHAGSAYRIYVADLASGAVQPADRRPGQRRLARVVARRLDDRVHVRAGRLPVRATRRRSAGEANRTTRTGTRG